MQYWNNYAALPSAINDYDQVAGNMLQRPSLSDSLGFTRWLSTSRPVVWDAGALQTLEDPGESVTISLNNHGQVVGMTNAGPLVLPVDEPWFPFEFLYGVGWGLWGIDGMAIPAQQGLPLYMARAVAQIAKRRH